ncbi:hypothetical protein PR202_ga04209 [Eleusine coracana subsp. coracana]|uniref:Uncharacterized protein n=1 Tax=Eleusine coracana subsp. coracana TaxID=191504 RepID=A0AAV5BSH3_ELECO|nr:hypothetical protein PR202_ga04209 [Eleusine coracana subsp. coracana]
MATTWQPTHTLPATFSLVSRRLVASSSFPSPAFLVLEDSVSIWFPDNGLSEEHGDHVGLACVARRPEQRPPMDDVVRMIESVPVDQSPVPEEDRGVSVTSSSVDVTTNDGEDGRLSYC